MTNIEMCIMMLGQRLYPFCICVVMSHTFRQVRNGTSTVVSQHISSLVLRFERVTFMFVRIVCPLLQYINIIL